jgi:hypothetical protein
MARFLRDSDYNSIIQSADLTQITEGTAQNLLDAETKAIARMRTKLAGRYMVDIELGGNGTYSASVHYRTKERILVTTTIYSVKDFDRWVNTTNYTTGNIVTDDDGYVYTAIANSQGKELTDTIFWTAMVNITQANTTYWAALDNRYALFVEVAMDLALYNLYSRINPRNIPDLRKERNREALDLLDAWASGTDKAEVLEVNAADSVGYSIRYGSSSAKQDNFFY